LYVSPQSIDAAALFSTSWKGLTGPVIQMSVEYGGTSGRFGVAQTIARVFPAHRAFVRKVIAEGKESASDFPLGPYPNDKLTYKNKETVEYETPAHRDGLGTQSRLQKNGDPIRGVAILVGADTNLLFLATRLPSEMNDLILQSLFRKWSGGRLPLHSRTVVIVCWTSLVLTEGFRFGDDRAVAKISTQV
jgi:hypothetical protein